MKKEKIHFVITGGTIDSYFHGPSDTVIPYKHSVIPEYMKMIKMYDNVYFTEVCMKDSRSLTKADMRKVLKTVEESKSKRVIITHGTYTMPDTARLLKAGLKRKDQTIIFIGSMVPLQGFSPSDAAFNMGYAIAKTEHSEPGIYVSFNGRMFDPSEVVKMLHEGRFDSIFSKWF